MPRNRLDPVSCLTWGLILALHVAVFVYLWNNLGCSVDTPC